MGPKAYTEPQCLYNVALYLTNFELRYFFYRTLSEIAYMNTADSFLVFAAGVLMQAIICCNFVIINMEII
jgi:hypothetical protein